MALISRLLEELVYKKAVKEKLGRHRQVSKQTGEKIEQKLSSSLQYIEGLDELPFRVARLPLWPTQDHIEGMIKARILVLENPFTGYLNSDILVNRNLFIGKEIPQKHFSEPNISQVIGYQIPSREILEKVIFDEESLAKYEGELFPIIYGMNNEAHQAYAKYLGGRIPTQEQLLNIWNMLPWEDNVTKAKNASIPFYGNFNFALFKNALRPFPKEIILRSSTNIHDKSKSIEIRWNTLYESDLPSSCFSTALVIFDKN